jgi:hypothetical protein
MTVFHSPQNNASATVATPRAPGAATITVDNGAPFGSAFPVIATALRGGGVLCILEVTGRAGNVLTVSGAIEGTTDTAPRVGDTLEMRPTALAIVELQGAIHALEADYATTDTAQTISGAKTLTSNLTMTAAVGGIILTDNTTA